MRRRVDAMIVVGSPNSSNSQRLKEVAERAGCRVSRLVLRADDIDWSLFGNIRSLGVTAGASAPEVLVEEIIDAFAERYEVAVETVSTADESVFFPLPRELRRPTRRRRSRSWPSTPKCPTRSSPPSSPATTSARCSPPRASPKGVENSNYLIHTGTGFYILTLYEKRVKEEDLPFFIGLMEHLAERRA